METDRLHRRSHETENGGHTEFRTCLSRSTANTHNQKVFLRRKQGEWVSVPGKWIRACQNRRGVLLRPGNPFLRVPLVGACFGAGIWSRHDA